MSSPLTVQATRGLRPSTLVLPAGPWLTLLEGLVVRFPAISADTWAERCARGLVLDADQRPLPADHPYQAGLRLHYYREVADEAEIPFREQILYQDEHLLVVDKPPFLPVIPSGRFVEQTLLARLGRQLDCTTLQPLHRLDRHTSGLVLFSRQPASRGAYQNLFRDQQIDKVYEALAPALPTHTFPLWRRSRIVRDEQFFRSRETTGECNAETRIEVLDAQGPIWRYALYPLTGKKHQLRLHLAALGAPIVNDALYPTVDDRLAEDYQRPLQLLARQIGFVDPLSGQSRRFTSQLALNDPKPCSQSHR